MLNPQKGIKIVFIHLTATYPDIHFSKIKNLFSKVNNNNQGTNSKQGQKSRNS